MLFPSTIEEIHVGRGLWLRVKVLTIGECVASTETLRQAVAIAVDAAAGPEEVITEGPAAGLTPSMIAKSYESVSGVARAAVIAYGQGEGESKPETWRVCKLVRNQVDHDEGAGRIAIAALDQVAVAGWQFAVADIALRAGMEAREEIRPLSESASR